MARPRAAGVPLTTSQYLTPTIDLIHIFDNVTYRQDLSVPVVAALIKSHIPRLSNLSEPFGTPNPTSKAQLDKETVTLPGSAGTTVSVYAAEKTVALELSAVLNIDEVEAFVICRRCRQDEGLDEEGFGLDVSTSSKGKSVARRMVLDQYIQYFQGEWQSVAQLLSALLRITGSSSVNEEDDVMLDGPDADTDPELKDLLRQRDLRDVAQEALEVLVRGDKKAFVHKLFTDFGKFMSKPVPECGPELRPLWAIHSLQLQLSILEGLFLYIYYRNVDVTANLTRGLINGALSSCFGGDQANSRIIQRLPNGEGVQLVETIQSLLGLICIESLRLDGLLSGDISTDTAVIDILPETDWHLVQSARHIASVHASIDSASPQTQMSKPFALLVLAWAIVLAKIPAQSVPHNGGAAPGADEEESRPPLYLAVVNLALRSDVDVFEKWRDILTGRLLWEEGGVGSTEVASAPLYKDVSRTLLSSLLSFMRAEYLSDYNGLVGVWCALFGEGTPETCGEFGASYWEHLVDPNSPPNGTEAILEGAVFPYLPAQVLEILTALSGAGTASRQETAGQTVDRAVTAAAGAFKQFTTLPSITVTIQDTPSVTKLFERNRDESSFPYMVNLRPLALPGGIVIPQGSKGKIISSQGTMPEVIRWDVPSPGWGLLLAIVKLCIGMDGADVDEPSQTRGDPFSSDSSDVAVLSLRDIGISLDSSGTYAGNRVVVAALSFIDSILNANPYLVKLMPNILIRPDAKEITADMSKPMEGPDLLDILFAILRQRSGSKAISLLGLEPISLAGQALSILCHFVSVRPGRIWAFLKSSGFFGLPNKSGMTCPAYLDAETKRGQYSFTTAVLRLLLRLSEDAQSEQCTISPAFLQQKTSLLAAGLHFVGAEIWSEYNTWKFQRISDKATIGLLVTQIYLSILKNPMALSARGSSVGLAPLTDLILDTFIQSPTPFTQAPLVVALRMPLTTLPALHRRQRYWDASNVETALRSALYLTDLLLAFKRVLLPDDHHGLESMLLGSGQSDHSSTSRSIVDIILEYTTSTMLTVGTTKQAAQLLGTLCENLETRSGQTTSLLSSLRQSSHSALELVAVLTTGDHELQEEVWSLLCIALESQPAVAQICITGGEEGWKPECLDNNRTSALAVALELLLDQQRLAALWDDHPRLLSLVIRFMSGLWCYLPGLAEQSGLADNEKLWAMVISLVQKHQLAPQSELQEAEVILYSYRKAARSYAINLLSTVMNLAPLEGSVKGKAFGIACKLLSVKEDMSALSEDAIVSSLDPALHLNAYNQLAHRYPGFSPQDTKSWRSVDARRYGADYLYDVKSVRESLCGDLNDGDNLQELVLVNHNWSLADSDHKFSTAWLELLNVAISFARREPRISEAAMYTAGTVAPDIAADHHDGTTYLGIQTRRYEILTSLLEIGWTGDSDIQSKDAVRLLKGASAMLIHPTWSPLMSLRMEASTGLHRSVFRTVYLILSKATPVLGERDVEMLLRPFLVTALSTVVEAIGELLDIALKAQTSQVDEDLQLLVSIISLILQPKFKLSSSTWLPHVLSTGLIQRSCDVLLRQQPSDQMLSVPHILDLHLSIAQAKTSAEYLITLGAMNAYGSVATVLGAADGRLFADLTADAGNPYQVWCQILTVANAISNALPKTLRFQESHILPLVNGAFSQLDRALEWNMEQDGALFELHEVQQVAQIYYGIACAMELENRFSLELFERFAPQALALLVQIRAAISQQGLLRSLVEEAEEMMMGGGDEMGSLQDRITGSRLAIRGSLLDIAQLILLTLMKLTRSKSVLNRYPELASSQEALILPQSQTGTSRLKPILEIASTLRELRNEPGIVAPPQLPRWQRSLAGLSLPTMEKPADLSRITDRVTETATILITAQAAMMLEADIKADAEAKARLPAPESPKVDKSELMEEKSAGPERYLSSQARQDLSNFLNDNGEQNNEVNVLAACRGFLTTKFGTMEDLW